MKLTKIVLILLTVVFGYYSLDCIQEKGIKFGMNFSTLSNQNMIDSELTPNISLGLFLKFRLNDKFSFQPEVYFSEKAINFDGKVNQYFDNDNDGNIDEDQFDLIDNDGDGQIDEDRIDFFCDGKGDIDSKIIEIPVLFNYLLTNSVKAKISIICGPSLNFIISNSINVGDSLPYDLQISDDVFDLGGVIGFDFCFNRFLINLRFSKSLLKNDWEIEPDSSASPFPAELISSGYYPRILQSNYTSFSLLIGVLL